MRRLVVALLVACAAVLALAPSAGAQEPTTTAPPASTVTTAAAGAAEGQAISGRLSYEDEAGERVAVEGVEVTVESADGSFSESGVSDADGLFQVPIPAAGNYTIIITESDLPDDVAVSNDRPELSVRVREGRPNTPVLFPLQFGDTGGRQVSTDADRAARLFVQGLRFGLIIAMCAIGLSLIFGTTRLTNFAHGEMVTFGAITAYFFNVTLDWHLIPAALTAIGIATIAGAGFDRFFWRPLRNRGTGLIAMLVISIGVSILFRYSFNFQFGGFNRAYAQYTLQRDGIEIGPLNLVPRDLIGMGLSIVVLVGVALFLQRTRMGKAMRAVADNRDLAESSGVDVDRVINLVWAAGAGLAALGGILQGLSEQVSWQMGFQLLLLMFAGVTLGGLGTAYGALVGSMVVGVVVEMSTLVLPSEFKTVTALIILILILLVRPQGILGQAERIG